MGEMKGSKNRYMSTGLFRRTTQRQRQKKSRKKKQKKGKEKKEQMLEKM